MTQEVHIDVFLQCQIALSDWAKLYYESCLTQSYLGPSWNDRTHPICPYFHWNKITCSNQYHCDFWKKTIKTKFKRWGLEQAKKTTLECSPKSALEGWSVKSSSRGSHGKALGTKCYSLSHLWPHWIGSTLHLHFPSGFQICTSVAWNKNKKKPWLNSYFTHPTIPEATHYYKASS